MLHSLRRLPPLRSVALLALLGGLAVVGACRVEGEPSGGGTGGAGSGQAGAPNLGGAQSDERQVDEKELAELREETLALVDETLACVEEEDCAALGIGAKPCGGAWQYRAYSTTSPKAGDLVTLANNLEKAEDEFNHAYSVQSDCAYVVEPDVECAEAVCVVVADN